MSLQIFRKQKLATKSDDDLMRELVGLNEAAMEVLLTRHERSVYGLALRILQNEASAADVAQNVFINLWRRAPQFDPGRGSVRTWLLTATRNASIDELRRTESQLRGSLIDDEKVPEPTAPEREQPQSELLDRLPVAQRQVLWLTAYGGYTHHQIADLLEVPLGTVKSRMRLGLERLRQESETTSALPV